MSRFATAVILCVLLPAIGVLAQQSSTTKKAGDLALSVIPMPVSCEFGEGQFTLPQTTNVFGPAVVRTSLQRYFGEATGIVFKESATTESAVIRASLDTGMKESVAGSYRLAITTQGIDISAGEPSGLFYAVQTLRQLMPAESAVPSPAPGFKWTLPCLVINDAPRFPWRGVMLDCGRHFFSVDEVKGFIDHIALYKFNTFHWHLTDDQGWRIEIKKYPKLTEIGAWRPETLVGHYSIKPRTYDGTRYGGFYTQEQIREVVAYAAERFVTIVPEIEMPGHSRAAIAAYPELGNTPDKPVTVKTEWGVEPHILNAEDSTVRFCQDVLDEVMNLSPSTFIHVGGDEAPKTEWKQSPRMQARIKELGLKDEHELQGWFITQMDKHLTAHGRRLIGWDEILEGQLAPGATVMSWRGPAGGIAAAKLGHQVVMCRNDQTYFDYGQSKDGVRSEPLGIGGLITLEKAYAYQAVPPELTPEQAKFVLGGQAQIWTEYIATMRHVNYMLFPRALATAEVLWSPAERHDYADFRRRVPQQLRLLSRLGVTGRIPD